eukprot:CAMPEP_0196690450 /NCGR_PEP_ID=MMETSP1090-20130531/19904_1 /TAXON_ID=37098 /ORGANISM="Isochrysis sp, Strain CCMP1244" /LENGTH=180 /DNA_ID=CAMNT_0042029551 /DNA_START=38 /DNA_END=578 /DNA_ORIENTATION=-
MPAAAAAQSTEADAATLTLGEDFQDGRCLLNSEVALILEHKLQASNAKGQTPGTNFVKAFEYVNRVKQFRTKEVMARVRTELEKQPIAEFEVAQLGNLCPEDADEAKALIASLALPTLEGMARDIDSAQLTEVLQGIATADSSTDHRKHGGQQQRAGMNVDTFEGVYGIGVLFPHKMKDD